MRSAPHPRGRAAGGTGPGTARVPEEVERAGEAGAVGSLRHAPSATARGARVVTEVLPLYGGSDIARFQDAWGNLWWLFSPATDEDASSQEWDDDSWEAPSEPDPVHTTIVDALRDLKDPRLS